MDYYLTDLSRLYGQPKKTIADYVESEGIPVPKRFDSLAEARASGLPIILRSEHVDEYARWSNGRLVTGVSGLLKSPDLDQFPTHFDNEAIRNEVFKELEDGMNSHALQYCSWLGREKEEFRGEVTFSYWEKLAGYNRTMIADSSIRDRYHITTMEEIPFEKINYTLFENGKVLLSSGHLPTESIAVLEKLVRFYEQIRNLPRFDQNNCPIMEIQTVGDQNYFLQYHRTRDFKEPGFTLERPSTKEEREAMFVRGATPPEGIAAAVTVWHAWRIFEEKRTLPTTEESSFDFMGSKVYPELMAPQRKLQMIWTRSLDMALKKVVVGHTQRSQMFKPEVSLIYRERDLQLPEDLMEKLKATREDQKIKLLVISDGRKAYYQRVD